MHHKLRDVRLALGLTVAQLAERSEVSTSAILRIESNDNEYRVNTTTASLLATALHAEVLSIFELGELSHLGRPPKSGRPLHEQTLLAAGEITCPSCCLITRPLAGKCTQCEQPILASVG